MRELPNHSTHKPYGCIRSWGPEHIGVGASPELNQELFWVKGVRVPRFQPWPKTSFSKRLQHPRWCWSDEVGCGLDEDQKFFLVEPPTPGGSPPQDFRRQTFPHCHDINVAAVADPFLILAPNGLVGSGKSARCFPEILPG